jgi:lysophospholipase L1-like esterase
LYTDNASSAQAAFTSATCTGGAFTGVSASFPAAQDLFCFVLYGSAVSSGTVSTIQSAMVSAFNAGVNGTANVVFDGDSINLGAYQTTALQGTARQAMALLNLPCNVWNFAYGGALLVNETTLTGRYNGLYDATKVANIAYNNGGTNDITAGTSAANLQTYITNWCAAARAANFKAIIDTTTPNNAWTGAEQTVWNTFNTWKRANWASIADGFADRQGDPTMGPFSAAANTTLYPDGLHPSTAGAAILAPYVAAAINALL